MEHHRPLGGGATSQASAREERDFRHLALFCRDVAEYRAGAAGFARNAMVRGDAVLVAVPQERAELLRGALGPMAGQAAFVDMAELGRNPGRIIPAVHAFAEQHRGRGVTWVEEPVWAGRSPPELLETARHEALVNLAFAGMQVTALCLYDVARLEPAAVTAAELTHPVLVCGAQTRPSPAYLGPGTVPPDCDAPLPAPPPRAGLLSYRTDLRPVREFVGRRAAQAGLPADRAMDLVIAVSELAANTLRHTPAGGTLRIWEDAGEIVCEVSDQGWIAEPLAGRQHPVAENAGGQGLWLVHQVCDLVEMRTGPSRTAIRLHLSLPG